jgi:hypothetical protein
MKESHDRGTVHTREQFRLDKVRLRKRSDWGKGQIEETFRLGKSSE